VQGFNPVSAAPLNIPADPARLAFGGGVAVNSVIDDPEADSSGRIISRAKLA
jgi:hypothetical protein